MAEDMVNVRKLTAVWQLQKERPREGIPRNIYAGT
jgi:hypothetical protein